jgi:hypothetical protein
MKRYARKKKGIPQEGGSFPIINNDAAGIDIGSEEHWVAVPEGRDENPVRPFGCFTSDLHAMARWLESMRCRHGRHGVDKGLLDPSLSDPRRARIRGKAWESRIHRETCMSGSVRGYGRLMVERPHGARRLLYFLAVAQRLSRLFVDTVFQAKPFLVRS